MRTTLFVSILSNLREHNQIICEDILDFCKYSCPTPSCDLTGGGEDVSQGEGDVIKLRKRLRTETSVCKIR